MDGQPDPADQPAQWVTMSLLRLLQFRLEASGKVGWWLRPPWNKKKDRPSVLDAERLMRRHREQIQRLLSKWARNGDCSKDTGLSHHAALALCRVLVV